MTQEKEALKLALEYMNEYYPSYAKQAAHHHRVNTAIKEALAQPEQIPPSAYSNTHQPEQEPVTKYCCHLCFNKSGQLFLDRMIVCPECGNKRCPKATHHELLCTNSNESNQAGSVYTTPPQPEPEPCDMKEMCIGCSPRNADGNCPDAQQEPVACQHKRYSIDVHEQIGNCLDCGAEGRMRFIVGTPQRTWEGLSVSEINDLVENTKYKDYRGLVATTETKLKDKNT